MFLSHHVLKVIEGIQKRRRREKHNFTSFSSCLSLGCCNKIPYTEWLNQHLSLTVLEAGKPMMKALADLVSVENPIAGL